MLRVDRHAFLCACLNVSSERLTLAVLGLGSREGKRTENRVSVSKYRKSMGLNLSQGNDAGVKI